MIRRLGNHRDDIADLLGVAIDRGSYGCSTGQADPDDLGVLLDRVELSSAIVLGLSAGARTALLRLVADTLARRMRNAHQVVVPDAGHGAHCAQPERLNAALLAFLTGVSRPPSVRPRGRSNVLLLPVHRLAGGGSPLA